MLPQTQRTHNQTIVTQPTIYQPINTNKIVNAEFVANIINKLVQEYNYLQQNNSDEGRLVTNFTAALNQPTTQDITLTLKVAAQILNKMIGVKIKNNENQFTIDFQSEEKKFHLLFEKNRVAIVDIATQSTNFIVDESIDFFSLQKYLVEDHKNQQSCYVNNEKTITCATGWAVGCIANSVLGAAYGGFAAGPLTMALGITQPVELAAPAATFLTVGGGLIAKLGDKMGLCAVSNIATNCCQHHDFENDMLSQHNTPDENMRIDRTTDNTAPSNSEGQSSIEGVSSTAENITERSPLLQKSQ